MNKKTVLVAGGGGFIGGHLIAKLLEEGCQVRSVDIKPIGDWFQLHDGVENIVADLKSRAACDAACEGVSEIYNLAANMGGMGFIESNKALCMLSVLINTHLLQAALDAGADRYFYSSSACAYPGDKQANEDAIPLKEEDAYPAMPEDGYGWEKLFSVPALSRGFRPLHARGPIPQRLWSLRHMGGRSRKSAGRHLPQGDPCQRDGREVDRNLGRWQSDAQLHARRRLR